MPVPVKYTLLILIILGFNHNSLLAQTDTVDQKVDSTKVEYYFNSLDSLTLDKLHPIDTSLSGFQIYDPVKQDYRFYATLGNIGLASYNMLFTPDVNTGFDYGLSAFNPYLFKSQNLKYYRNIKPYTKLSYANGPKKEQLFRVIHSQNIGGRVIISADFRFLQSFGYYNRQKSDDKSIYATAQYFTRNKRYGVLGTYVHDKIIVQENGGITNDSIFEENLENDRKLFGVNLKDAENQVKYASLFLNQYFFLSKPYQPSGDTTDTIPVKRSGFHLGKLSYAIKWERDKYLYTDNDPLGDFYKAFNPVIDSTVTHDSSYFRKFTNDLSWSNLRLNDKPEDKPVYLYFGAKYTISKAGNDSTSRSVNQLIPYGGFSVFVLKSFRLNFDLNYVIGDYNGGDFAAKAQIQQFLGNKYKNLGLLIFDAQFIKRMPSWFYQEYYGNNFRWMNNFPQQEYIIISAHYRYKNFSGGARLYQLKNYVFLDNTAHPAQDGTSFSVIQAFAGNKFILGKFGIYAKLVYQTSTKSETVSVPAIIGYLDLNFKTDIFKGATTIQPGLDFYYNTSYYGDAYMPALQSFYQNEHSQVGNYLIASVYMNFKIKRARFFFKYAHFNAGWLGYNYMAVPNYPLKDAAFKFGISWRFWD